MICSQARDHLPALVYGDLDSVPHVQVAEHVQGCSACCQELTELQEVRQMLNSVPAPKTEVDVSLVYRQDADCQRQKLKRWRRAALVMSGVAALVLLAVGLPFELRLEKHQVTVRWGKVLPTDGPAPRSIDAPSPLDPRLVADAEQMQLQRDLIKALQRDANSRDQQRNQELARLTVLLISLQRQADQRWSETEQNVAALYLLTRKGNQP